MNAIVESLFGPGSTPSRMMTGYVIRRFAARYAAMLIVLTTLLTVLDLLNTADEVLAAAGAGDGSLIKYVSLRAPELISQFAPFTALLAVLLTLGGFSQTSEITAMRASGVSVHGVLFPFGIACAALATAHFAFHEIVVTPASAELAYWRGNDFAVDLPLHEETRTNIRLALQEGIVEADTARRTATMTSISDLTVFARNKEGLLVSAFKADEARDEGAGWTLFNVRRIDVGDGVVSDEAEAPWNTSLTPDRFFLLTADPDHTSLAGLVQIVRIVSREGAFSGRLATAFWHRIAAPLATLLMPLMGAVAGFGVHRAGNLLGRLAFGAALGFSFFVVDNLMVALGGMGAAPPIIAAFSPLLIFLIAGLYVALSMER